MRTIKTSSGAEVSLDGDLLSIMEALYHEVTTSPQGTLIPLTSQDALVVYRVRAARRRTPSLPPTP